MNKKNCQGNLSGHGPGYCFNPIARASCRTAPIAFASTAVCRLLNFASATLFIAGMGLMANGIAADDSMARMLLSEAALQQAVQRGDVIGRRSASVDMPADGKDYRFPALEIVGFQFLLNRFDNLFVGPDYDVSLSSIRRNLHSSWVVDRDPFAVNELGHPYQGSVYYGIARSTGLNFWESFGYTFAASALWEIAGETTLPSRNDQITTSFAGTFLGESLFRMANLILERGELPSPWRGLVATAISPPTGFNRAVFPERFGKTFASRDPATFSRLQLGGSGTVKSEAGTSAALRQDEAIIDFSLDYGLPGKPGYDYTRPFDYFSFQVRGSSARTIESIHDRGLIAGRKYEVGPRYRGIWGLYGSYDYLAPQLFRLSSSALSLGTTGQWQASRSVAVQGSVTAGVGFTSTGTIQGTAMREYNYGFAPQALMALRVIFGDSASFDVTARNYFAGRLADSAASGRDRVFRADASFTVRIHRNHAIAIKYVSSRRDSSFPDLGQRFQRRDTLGVYYTYLGSGGFGAVNW